LALLNHSLSGWALRSELAFEDIEKKNSELFFLESHLFVREVSKLLEVVNKLRAFVSALCLYLGMKKSWAHFLFPFVALLMLTPWASSGVALLSGLVLALAFGNPYSLYVKQWTHRLLATSVVCLGAGMNLAVIGQVGLHGIGYTVLEIAIVLLLGGLLGRLLNTEKDTSLLITVGTAICGGSAIAAVSSVIRAKHHEVSVALGTIFILNAFALVTFPWLGHRLQLDQNQFGLWSALAIHDTSSVVGATLQYGIQACEVGTTVKLSRALWIIPVAALIGWIRSRKKTSTAAEQAPIKRPWFILGFLIAAAIVTWIPSWAPFGQQVEAFGKKLMVLTLFLIGSSLTRETVRSVGIKPFIQGIVLWFVMACGTLTTIYYGIIH
jgi:uncharacterized integral membrane protein (TIGR00698 family)